MGDQTVGEGARYRAFISYSHKDAAFGRWLHRRLEAYLIPHRLVGRISPSGTVPRRLVPIFRDREELPAANDLSTEVQAALQDSASLIVVSSREAAASKWVSREVDLFRALHPGRPVLAAIRSGEPPDCFPQSLLRHSASGEAIEPLAADFRRSHDGEQLGLLKLVAGMVGIGLDELIQRDTQRRLQRVTAITALAFVAVLVMSALTIFALNARTEAERQRAEVARQRSEAEGLVEFMFTDLRGWLKGVGRLDVMSSVSARALHYYRNQDIKTLPVDSLERRARILHTLGEDDEQRGDGKAALAKFEEAQRTTSALLANAPNDTTRIFNHAQSEFFIGLHEYNENNFPAAKREFLAYRALANKLVSIAPNNPKFHQEIGYADSNLCAVAEEHPFDPRSAIRYCSEALAQAEWSSSRLKTTPAIVGDLIDRHAWLADAYFEAGDLLRARSERAVQEKMLESAMSTDRKNMDLKDTWVVLQRALANIDQREGKLSAARQRLINALATSDTLVRFDRNNKDWATSRVQIVDDLSTLNATHEKRRYQ